MAQLRRPTFAGMLLYAALLAFAACSNNETNETIMKHNNDECIICGKPLVYLQQDTLMECMLCHKQELSKTRCEDRHHVCSKCHTQGMDAILNICLGEQSKDPIAILDKMMSQPFCHMHGPEHHVLVAAALLTAYNNALPADSSRLDLPASLSEAISRGQQVPGGACGYLGACGASISTGIFMSIITHNTPLSTESWKLCNLATAKALEQVALNGGPRCCKRDSYLSILAAVSFVEEHLGVTMECGTAHCSHSQQNNQCIGKKCPFHHAQ